MSNNANVTVMLKITNCLATPRTLVIEPWTTEYDLPPGKTLDVVARGDPKYPLEVEVEEGRIVVTSFDSAGATMSVLDRGAEAKPAGS